MFLRRAKQTKRDVAIGLDLGTSRIKAAVLRRQGTSLELSEYAVAPTSHAGVGRPEAQQQFAAQLQQLMSGLSVQERRVSVTISSDSAIVCEAEFPRMPLDEVKSALKLNSSRYLRRDFSNYYLDAVELAGLPQDGKERTAQAMKVLVGGANKEEVLWYRGALLAAKIRPEVIELAAVSVINAFQVGNREACEKEVVVLVDIGARSTSINFLRHGQPLMTRITHFGGSQISEYLAQMLTIEVGAAEEEKLKMSDPVQPLVRSALVPLAKEVRSSIDFFERQHECHVTKAFACGGSASAPAIIDFLSDQVGTKIECWNPIQSYETSHFNGDGAKLTALAPSLAAAVGAAAVRV
jgi:type IV pilus assembly protein PilM